MNHILTTPETLSALAGEHRGHARAAEALAAADGGLTGLGPTFGLIGLDFLTALAEVQDARRRGLTHLANAHDGVAGATTSAGTRYDHSDDTSSADLGPGVAQ